MIVVGPQKIRQYPSVKGVALGLTHAKPVPSTIQDLGIDRVNHYPVIQKKIHNAPVWLLNRCPQLDLFSSALIEPTPQLRQSFRILLDFHLHYLYPVLVATVQLVHSVRPIYSQIVSWHFVVLLLCLIYPIAVNGMLALYRSSTGQLSIELLTPSFCWSGRSPLDPLRESRTYGPLTSKLLGLRTQYLSSYAG
jgi:hypothetical protein